MGAVIAPPMKHLIYGDGKIQTAHGKVDGLRCITMQERSTALPVGATSLEGPSTVPREKFDVILSFRNIEGARLLQDMLNELVCEWSRDNSVKVDAL